MVRLACAGLAAIAGLAFAGCGDGGNLGGTGDRPPLAVAIAAQSPAASIAAHRPARKPQRARPAGVRRSSGHPAEPADAEPTTPTPAGPRRRRAPSPARALPSADAGRLAAPACATYADALAGRFPDNVLARGPQTALAHVSESMAAALIGLPVDVPEAGLAAREKLDRALRRLARTIASGDAPASDAVAQQIRAYARALGIDDCG